MNARKSNTMTARFETLVFRQVPTASAISESVAERLPGAELQRVAWQKLYAALARDRDLIDGTIMQAH